MWYVSKPTKWDYFMLVLFTAGPPLALILFDWLRHT